MFNLILIGSFIVVFIIFVALVLGRGPMGQKNPPCPTPDGPNDGPSGGGDGPNDDPSGGGSGGGSDCPYRPHCPSHCPCRCNYC